MTRSELRSEVASSLGKTTINDRIDEWLNLSQIEIVKAHEFQNLNAVWERDTVADQKSYAFPSTIKDVHTFRLIDGSNSKKLTRVTSGLLDKYVPAPAELTTGRPSHYLRYGNVFELWKIPDAVYTLRLRCSLWLTPFSADGQSCDLSNIDILIIDKTMEIGYRALQEKDEADSWRKTFKDDLALATFEDKDISDMKRKAAGFAATPEVITDKTSNPLYGIARR